MADVLGVLLGAAVAGAGGLARPHVVRSGAGQPWLGLGNSEGACTAVHMSCNCVAWIDLSALPMHIFCVICMTVSMRALPAQPPTCRIPFYRFVRVGALAWLALPQTRVRAGLLINVLPAACSCGVLLALLLSIWLPQSIVESDLPVPNCPAAEQLS